MALAVIALIGPVAGDVAKVNYVVTGAFVYYDHDGRLLPAAGVTARIMDKDIESGDSDDFLATAVTDADGKFRADFSAEEYQDIYVAFVAENDIYKVADSSGGVYQWNTPVTWDVAAKDAGVDIGTQSIGGASDSVGNGQNAGAMWIYQSVRKSAEFASRQALSLTGGSGLYSVVWTDDNDTTYSTDMTTYVARNHSYMHDVITHETGHVLMNAYSRVPKGSGGRHKVDGAYSRELAWAEGWATFYAACVIFDASDANAYLPYFAGGVSVENVPANFAEGDTNEMRVAGALWDLYDSNADGSDNVSMKFADIFEALRRSDGREIGNFEKAVTLLVQYNRADKESAEAIYKVLGHNTISYKSASAPALVANE